MISRLLCLPCLTLALSVAVAQERGGAGGQAAAASLVATGQVEVLPVQGRVWLVSEGSRNIVVQLGGEGLVMVDTPSEGGAEAILKRLHDMEPQPVRFIVNTSSDSENWSGNAAVSRLALPLALRRSEDGRQGFRPSIVAHENVLNRMTANREIAGEMWPTLTYFLPKNDLYLNDEAAIMYHMPAAHSDGDSIVFFRGSDVIAAGELYAPNRYPRIDVARGGSVDGLVAGLAFILDIAVARAHENGGTRIVGSEGRISERVDVAEYRNMIIMVRDRIQDGMNKAQSLQEILNARLTRDFDAEYRVNRKDADEFVTAIHLSLQRSATKGNAE